MKLFFEYSLVELEDYLVNNGFKKFNGSQIFDWVYKKLTLDFNLMSNISKELREHLIENMSLDLPTITKKEVSKDSTVKYLFNFSDDSKVEGVLMHHPYGVSYCISSQVGCNMGCAFCASGLKKKSRDLTSGEMVSMIIKSMLDSNERISHIVIMGTGEPLDNFKNVIKFNKTLNAPKGLEIGIRHITLSTSGLAPKIKDLADQGMGINLAISLHAPTDDLRCKLMPINKAYKISEVLDAANYYFNKTGRRITFEYLLLEGVNDSTLYANKLADIVKGLNSYVNLIPYNHVDEFEFKESNSNNVNRFYNELKSRGINVTMRHKMGDDIDAACGQLRSKILKEEEYKK